MSNKKILVTQSSIPTYEEYCEEIKDIFESKWLTNNGKKHNQLEKELCDYLQVDNISLFCNGHMALYNAIKFFDLKGDIITTPFTFASTTHAIVENGLTPVFCDINREDCTIDANKIEELITEKTCAIVAVHVYGNPCDVSKIEEIAKKHNLKVIYDAAHAFGVECNNIPIANFGDISMFSFHATKVFNTIEGGALVYQNKDWYQKFYEMKNFGIVDEETIASVGMNSKMNEFQAAMGLCNLRHIDEEISKRKKVYEKYIELLKDIVGIRMVISNKKVKQNYAYLPIIIEDSYPLTRDELQQKLVENNIFTRKYFYPLVSDFECYKNIYDSNNTPIAKEVAKRILTLPMYANLDLKDVENICNLIKENQ